MSNHAATAPAYRIVSETVVEQRLANGSYERVGHIDPAAVPEGFTVADVAEAILDLGRALDAAAQHHRYTDEAAALHALDNLPGLVWGDQGALAL